MFKAEECQKFIQWCLPHILNVVDGISEEDTQIGMLLVDIAHMFFDCSRQRGWTMEYIATCRSLLLSWRILSEEYDGVNASPLEHVAGNGEMLDDVLRHGSHDGTWCFSHERNISGYLSISTNNKSNELSYSKFHSRILFTWLWKQLNIEKDGIKSSMRDMLFIHSCLILPESYTLGEGATCYDIHEKCVFHASSEKKANDIWDASLRLPPCACQNLIQRKGVLVGPKRPKASFLDVVEREGLIDFWVKKDAHTFNLEEINPIAFFYCKVFVNKIKYTIGEHIVIQGSSSIENEETTSKGCLKKIFTHEQRGELNVFIVVECILESLDDIDEVSGMCLIHKSQKANCSLIVRTIDCLLHKFFWLRTSLDDKEMMYETSGVRVHSRLLYPGKPGCVPPWIEEGDLVLARHNETLNSTAFVTSVDGDNKRALLAWEDMQFEEAWVDWKYIYKVLQGHHEQSSQI